MTINSLKLYHYWRSSCSWRVRWSLHFKEIPFDSIHINLLKNEHKTEKFREKNSLGLVPSLQINSEFYLNESLAILEWLEESYDQKKLLPDNLQKKNIIREISYLISSTLQPLQNLQTLKFYSKNREDQIKWANHWLQIGFKAFEAKIEPFSSYYCIGNQLTFVDLCLVPQIYNAKRFNFCFKEFKLLEKIYENCLETPSCKKSHPDNYKPTSF